jgi:hypothetical protein
VNLGYLDFHITGYQVKFLEVLEAAYVEKFAFGGELFPSSIPELLRFLRALQYLNLSHSNFTGQIPKFLAGFRLLQYLDLSFNDIQGEMPTQGVLGNASAVSVLGNSKLCGGISQLNLSRCIPNNSKGQTSSTEQMLIIAIPCGFLGFFFMIACLLFCCFKITKNKPSSESSREFSFRRVTYKELFQATVRFSSSNLIGAGSFGSVYKGVIASDGAIVAVKVFKLLSKGASKSFMSERAALINIRHRNLVRVLSARDGVDFQGNDFKSLVYEFMVNGSLEEW